MSSGRSEMLWEEAQESEKRKQKLMQEHADDRTQREEAWKKVAGILPDIPKYRCVNCNRPSSYKNKTCICNSASFILIKPEGG